ncbi:aromatic ring-opening dioxygenase LigA [Tessaracoccus sp. MC1756]|uniref:aromatic ring-opening dioxygenase LigA n=1 Tax=Tessaracoccus sp. MC1756 TaxID=2760311 RepID=UPI001602DF8A|nr:aromatic ring-opening dioxygenase LigA [Tessaracoccus sp. MC1756]MBB1509012.1 aromatic ring-opening dioxygenase LigA [Tessaracoccus sp. MC1756]
MKATKLVGILSIIAGVVLIVAGAVTWTQVSSQLKAENITVPGDSTFMNGAYAGKEVTGPLSAFAQADTINMHALAGSEGKTYAELGSLAREAEAAGDTAAAEEFNKQRNTVMNGSFLRASLFTSVVAFGVAALVIGLGILFALIGWALTTIRPVVGRVEA